MANSSPMLHEKRMNGTSGKRSRARARAFRPSNVGSVKSEMIRSTSPLIRAISNAGAVCTLLISQRMPSSSSHPATRSTSRALSSRCRIFRISRFIGLARHSGLPGRRLGLFAGVRLIEHCPENAQILDCFGKLFEADGLHDVRLDSELVAFDQVFVLARRGDSYQRAHLQFRVRFASSQNFQAVDFGQLQVEQNKQWKLP